MRSKRVLAILLSLALLIGLVPVAGILTAAAVGEETDPTVYEITFNASATVKEKIGLGNYSAVSSASEWIATFEYYFDGSTAIESSVTWGGTVSNATNSITLQPGRHTASISATCTNGMTPYLTVPLGTAGTLYVWDVLMTVNGAKKSHYVHPPIVCDCGNDRAFHSTATVTEGGTLSTYPFVPNADGSVKKMAVYVDGESGADTNDGSAIDNAVQTLSKALNLIQASPYLAADIYIVGTYTTDEKNGQYDMTSDGTSATRFTTDWTKPVTIQSAPGTEATLDCAKTSLWVCGPTTFDNITIAHTATQELTFMTREKDVVFTDTVTMGTSLSNGPTKAPALVLGDYGMSGLNDAEHKPMELTIDGGNYFQVLLGDSCSSSTNNNLNNYKNHIFNGALYTQNGGTAYKIIIGSTGNNAEWNNRGTSYLDDVNVVINGGKVSGGIYITDDTWVSGTNKNGLSNPSSLNGHAVQIVLNNGVTVGSLPTAQDAIDMGGSLYLLRCATGVSLSATAEAGVYIVNAPDVDIVATDMDDTSKTYSPIDGVLTVPAGNYRVGRVVAENHTVYVSDSGNDDNVGTSADAPFKTLLKAVQSIENSGAKTGSINVVGTLTVDSAFAMSTATGIADLTQMHSMPITIQGNEGKDSTLTISEVAGDYDLFLYGDIVIDNIKLNVSDSCSIFTNKFDLAIGPNVELNGAPNIWLGHFNASDGRTGLVEPTEPTALTVSGGTYDIVQLGGRFTHNTSNSKAGMMAGADVLLNGGTVKRLYVGHLSKSGFTAGVTYTDDVNITFNGGTVEKLYLGDFVVEHTVPTTLSGNALQILLNNGAAMPKVECSSYLTDSSSLAAAVASMNGELYVMRCADDVALTATDEAGVYTVKSDYDVVAVCKETGERFTAVDGVLTVPAAGTYAVGDGVNVDFGDDGMIPEDAVWKIDFPAMNTTNTLNALWTNLTTLTVGEEYTFSFDYYYEDGDRLMIHDATRWGISDNPITWGDREKWIYPDKGTMTKTFTATHSKFYPAIEQPEDSSGGVLYIWNFSLVKTGTTKNLYAHADLTFNRENNPTPFVYMVDVDPDTFVDPIVPGEGDDANGDGIISANEATGPVEDNVYRFNFSKYDWEENNMKTYKARMAYITFPDGVKEGMELTLSFDWCVQTNCFVYFFNPYASWGEHKEHPGTQYSEIQDIRTEFWGPDKGTFSFSFTTNENDVKNGGGKKMALAFEASQNYGKSDIYFWNLKLTEKGSDVNLLTYNTFVWDNDDMLEVVDIDPTKLEMWETVMEEEDNFDDSVDMDTGDVVIEDNSALLDRDTQISVEYEDGSAFDADTLLDVYTYDDGGLEQAILDVIGDKNYVAYDIALALDGAFIEPSGMMKVGIPIPEDFNAEQVFLYGMDAYGMLYAIDYEITYGMAYFTTDVLGTFILVEGELVLPEAPAEGDEPMDGDEPTDGDEPVDDGDKPADTKPNKNNKKDDKSNGWILWVAIGGGVALLAAVAAIILLVLKKKKGAKADAE